MKKIITIFTVFGMLFYSGVKPVIAAVTDYRIVTWNLQGSSAASESKWNINVRQLVSGSDGADILMIQEAGSLPLTAVQTPRQVQPVGIGIPINEYTWNLGTTRRPDIRYIYYSRVDVGANRVNLAIVSRQQADNVFVIRPPTTISRPVIGIQIRNDVFLTTHSLASGGPDSAAIVRSVNMFFNQPRFNHLEWFLAGDLNRSPSRLENDLILEGIDRDVTVVAPAVATQRSGGILDYGVISARAAFASALTCSLFLQRMRSQLSSDHLPVGFFKGGQ
ncbi:cytolethal distending toxin subunit B family protein [Salmonella enterica]|uniref:Cytolethal distending toxin subunit B family protein n=1 Tax=Salmonella enterica TaxID=28901 RepID=A0A5V1PK99_SALER|nr:cytolethal distending toxin subunit B family protein [Salmonella enterica]EBW8796500.1 cytolethal distending toxin subunit B family protein [Salmonella enterica subsp. enterica serovar Oranienburg]ECC3861039.1 cytolethal distending toxin subunit B family protein [Salmonella enterica subsp. enterica]ECZ5371545.1 cytolethal distending toxin subunit B family protein [Salmonella enterica subsp. enterica serovar Give]EDR7293381.1 cytolethal distending toxin subunit B family protein [Salmonella en